MIPRIGSQGPTMDAKFALESACDIVGPGHGWEAPDDLNVQTKGSPKCKDCVNHWKARLAKRGCTDRQVREALERIGVKFPKKRQSERPATGLDAIEANGGNYLDWLRAKEKRDKNKGRNRKPRKLGDHLVGIDPDDWTPELDAHNAKVEAEREAVIEQRERAIERGEDPFAIKFPDAKVYVRTDPK